MLELLSQIILPSLVSAFGWGVSPMFDKLALKNMNNDYYSVMLYKIIFGGILCLFLLLLSFKNTFKIDFNNKKHKNGLMYIMLGGLSTFLFGYIFYFYALSKSKYTTEIVMLTYVLPIFIISILSYYILNENFNCTMVIGMIIAIVGIIIFLYGGHYQK